MASPLRFRSLKSPSSQLSRISALTTFHGHGVARALRMPSERSQRRLNARVPKAAPLGPSSSRIQP